MTGLIAEAEAEVARVWAQQQGARPDGAHDFGHLARVWANCQAIMLDEEPIDAEALHLAVIFHDIINLPKNDPLRAQAAERSALHAAQWLAARGWPDDRIARVAHAIEAHSFSGAMPPQSTEARILQDADRLEALGAIGLARMFAVAGQMGAQLFDPADPMALMRDLDDRAYALDHLETKLFVIAQTMQTSTGRAIAAERAEWMASFRTRLLSEIR
jgi:uncharacterized protein